MAESFAKDLDKRERAKVQMEYFCEHFPVWRIEGMRKDEVAAERKLADQELKKQEELESLEQKRKELVVLKKKAELKEDARLSSQINTMMIKYGMITLAEDTQSYSTDVDQIFDKHRKLRKKKEKELERSQCWHEADDIESVDSHTDSFLDSEASKMKVMDLSLHPSTSREALIGVRNVLRKNRFKKDKRVNVKIWTLDDFQDTADVHVLHCQKVEEVGALSLAVELSKGAFSSLEVLDLHHCHVRDLGVCRIMQAMKMSQLLTLRILNLNGNLLTSKCIDYMRQVGSQSPVLQVLEELHLSRNELGDDGVEAMIRIVFLELLPCIRVIVMSFNSITDKGFRVMINALAAIHEVYLPHIECFNVNNNLITPALRRELAPLPHFISV
ncbi:hypothetical protein EON65_22855 [archaeon]|nr:MAG: hypothetical protein EON65_22855 [archaeon]